MFLARMGLIDVFLRLNCLVAVFLCISVLNNLMDKTVQPIRRILNKDEAKVLFEGVMPAAHAVTQIMLSSPLVAAAGALFEVGSFRDYTLGRWSADAAVGSYVSTGLFTFITDKTNDGPHGDLGAWVAPIAVTFLGTLIIWLRDQSSFASYEIAAEDPQLHYGGFVCLFFSTLAFTAAATGFFLRPDAILYGGYIHDVWGGLVAELLAALVAKKFLSKYHTGIICMIVTVPLMVIYDELVIQGFVDAGPFMLFVTVVVVKLTTSLLREASGLLHSKTGMPTGKVILLVDVAATLGVISGHIFTKFLYWGRQYLFAISVALMFAYPEKEDLPAPAPAPAISPAV